MDATPNLSLTQPAAPLFDRVPDELLLMILSFAMDTTTPCLFGRNGCFNPEYDGDDAKSCRTLFGENTQEAHRADWLAVNSISSRFRRVGMEAFFASKTFIITAGTLARLHAHVTGSELPTDGFYWNSNFDEDFEFYPYIEDWKRSKEFNFYFAERDLESVLRTIRHLCVIYVEIDWPSWWIELPTRLTIFPNLRYFAGCESLAFCPCGMAVMGDPAETEIDSRDTQLMRSFLVKNGMSKEVAFHWVDVRPWSTKYTWVVVYRSQVESTFAAVLDHFYQSSLHQTVYQLSKDRVSFCSF